MNTDTLGIDIGGVIIDRMNDGTDTSFFSENYLKTTPVPWAFAAIRRLFAEKFNGRVFLVSKCGPRNQAKTLEWLDHNCFYDHTGVRPEQVYFCRERHQKAGICRNLGITHFIDDRLEVLISLTTVRTLYLFNPVPEEIKKFERFLLYVRRVNSWNEVLLKEGLA